MNGKFLFYFYGLSISHDLACTPTTNSTTFGLLSEMSGTEKTSQDFQTNFRNVYFFYTVFFSVKVKHACACTSQPVCLVLGRLWLRRRAVISQSWNWCFNFHPQVMRQCVLGQYIEPSLLSRVGLCVLQLIWFLNLQACSAPHAHSTVVFCSHGFSVFPQASFPCPNMTVGMPWIPLALILFSQLDTFFFLSRIILISLSTQILLLGKQQNVFVDINVVCEKSRWLQSSQRHIASSSISGLQICPFSYMSQMVLPVYRNCHSFSFGLLLMTPRAISMNTRLHL